MVASATPLERIRAATAEAWRPRPRLRSADWCAENLNVSDESGARVRRFRNLPWVAAILDALDDQDVETIAIRKPTQIGGTTIIMAGVVSRAAVDPAPMLFAGPDQGYCTGKARLMYRFCDATPALAGRVPPERRRNPKRQVHLGNCVCYLGWSGSPQSLSGNACKIVWCSEVDRWRDHPKHGASAEIIQARVMSFAFGWTIVYESSPTDEVSAIDGIYEESNRCVVKCPCPHCGHFQELRLLPHKDGPHAGRGGVAGLQDKAGRWLSPEDARRKAYYLCERGCRIDSIDKPAMIAAGVVCPRGQDVDVAGNLTGTPERSKRHWGIHLTALLIPHFSWGKIAAAYLRARAKEKLREFWNNWLGLAWKTNRRVPKWQDLGRRLAGQHVRGRVPAEAYFLTSAGDVQLNRLYWIIRAWGAEATSWLIDWGMIRRGGEEDAEDDDVFFGALSNDLAQLGDRIVTCRLPVDGANPWGQTELGIALAGADSNYRTMAVLKFIRAHPGYNVRALGGNPKPRPGEPWRMSPIDKNARTGKPYPGGLEKWWIDTGQFKEEIQGRWHNDPAKPGAWLLPANVLAAGEDYLRQVTNEALRIEITPSGRKVKTWDEINKGTGNHYFDCEGYSLALAHMVVGGDFSQANLDRLARAAAGQATQRTPEAAALDARETFDDFGAR